MDLICPKTCSNDLFDLISSKNFLFEFGHVGPKKSILQDFFCKIDLKSMDFYGLFWTWTPLPLTSKATRDYNTGYNSTILGSTISRLSFMQGNKTIAKAAAKKSIFASPDNFDGKVGFILIK